MTFVVRQIARTADGREIVRPASFAKDRLAVGRGTDSDILLEDLAATLHHVTISETGPDRIRIEAAAGLPFDIDGASRQDAEIAPSRGANLRIGSHSLDFSRGEGGETVITVERVGSISEASEDVDESRAFSLAGRAPGKRGMAWALIALTLAAFLAWPIWSFYSRAEPPRTLEVARERQPNRFHADETWSSGKLSLAHANLENDCKACHVQPFVAVRDDTCIACHDDVHNHADPRRLVGAKEKPGFFRATQLKIAGAFNIPPGRCVECHTEHEGAKQMPVTAQRFCTDCHASLDQRLRDTKLDNAGDFTKAHPQFKVAVLTNWKGPRPQFQRMSLDASPREDSGLKFPHALHLSASNGVARMAQTLADDHGFGKKLECKNCHTPDRTGVRFNEIEMEESCGMCHSLAFDRVDGTTRTLRHGEPRQVIAELRDFYAVNGPSRPPSLGGMARRRPGDFAADRTAFNYNAAVANRGRTAAAAIRAVFTEGGACYDCHRIDFSTGGGLNVNVHPVKITERYMSKGWFDHEPHKKEKCETCHAAKSSNSSADVLLPKIATCRECHGGESARKEVPSSCAMCHDYHVGDGPPSMAKRVRRDRIASR